MRGIKRREPTTCRLCITAEQRTTSSCGHMCIGTIVWQLVISGNLKWWPLLNPPMAKSEIDDIFASKGKGKATQSVVSSSTPPVKKHKKDKKKNPGVDPAKIDKDATTKKRPAPETVVDPSTRIPSAKRAKVSITTSTNPSNSVKTAKGKGDEDRFKDSRGTGPRKSSLFLLISPHLTPVSRP